MPTATANQIFSVGGITIQGLVSRTAEGQISQEVSLPASDQGTLTTRVSDTAGTLTMDSESHGISTGDKIDIFWYSGSTLMVAYGATVGTVSTTSVPFTGASGSVLPAQDSVVTADVLVAVDVDWDGDLSEIVALKSDRNGHFDFQNDTPASLKQDKLLANEPWSYISGQGGSNPLTGDPVDKLYVTNADKDNAATVQLGVLYDSVS